MTYTKAKKLAQQGKMLSRRGWDYLFGWYHITATNGQLLMNDPMNGYSEETQRYVRQWAYEPTKEDESAKDWEVMETIRKWR